MNQNQNQRQNHMAASSAKTPPTKVPAADQVGSTSGQESWSPASGAPLQAHQPAAQNLRAYQSSSALQHKLQQLGGRAEPEPEAEKSALELAQSAASMAAAKFKLLRSNTLAAAFGRAADQAPEAPTGSGASNQSWDLLASMRAKDERVVSALSPPANRIQ